MNPILEELNSDFRIKVIDLIQACKKRGVVIVPACAYRNVFDQAILWRQSRSAAEIKQMINYLEIEYAFFLSFVMNVVGPRNGFYVTDAIPGRSWHQYGEAIDCYVLKDGVPSWDINDDGYKIYRKEGLRLGMYTATEWDWGHLQATNKGVLHAYISMTNINNIMLLKHVKDISQMGGTII